MANIRISKNSPSHWIYLAFSQTLVDVVSPPAAFAMHKTCHGFRSVFAPLFYNKYRVWPSRAHEQNN